MDLSRLDTQALRTFEALYEEKSVTLAAQKLRRTQSAVSHSLKRLRDFFEDPLFYREGWQMLPTARANELIIPISKSLNSLRQVFEMAQPFDPSKSEQPLRIAGPDVGFPVIQKLLRRIRLISPDLPLELLPNTAPHERLVFGQTDILFSFGRPKASDYLAHFSNPPLDWEVFAHQEHPFLVTADLATWAQAQHIIVATSTGGTGPIGRAISPLGISRNIGLKVPTFHVAAQMVANKMGLFTTLGAPFSALVEELPVKSAPTPFSIAPATFHISCRRGSRSSRDAWIHSLLDDIFG